MNGIIKICGITTQEDAQQAIAAGANALGFNFYRPSPRYILPAIAGVIAATLPEEVLRVGVFVNEEPKLVRQIARIARLHVVQLHGDEDPSQVPAGLRVWKAYRVKADFSLDQLAAFPAEAYLLDSPSEMYGGSGHPFDWKLATGAGAAARKILLAGGLDAGNVGEAIRQSGSWGVDACSRLEQTPGRKDHAKVSAFVAAARAGLQG